MDRNTKNGLWDFYVKECNDKGSISNIEPSDDECDEPYDKNRKNSYSVLFFKPYLDAQEGNEIYNFEESNEYSPQMPIPTKCGVSNLDEFCKSEEFRVIRYSIGSNEEYITISPSKCDTWGKTHGTMSCIYHDLFNKKDHRWLDSTYLGLRMMSRLSLKNDMPLRDKKSLH
ncbi:hypothetical protein Tco_0561611 [Tanacetum coccineum]